MVKINSGIQYNMYVRYGSKKRSDFDSDFLNGDDATELLSAADIVLMISGKKLGSVLDGLFPEKNQSDATMLEWLEPDVSMNHMSPTKFAKILEDISDSVADLIQKTNSKEDVSVLKNNKMMSDFMNDINRLSRQIKIRAKVATPNA